MLISPLSNVSVPFAVVIRTLSNSAESDFLPEFVAVPEALLVSNNIPVATQVRDVEFSRVRVIEPQAKVLFPESKLALFT